MTNRLFYEFFAGGGMARLGLGLGWHCLMANDIDSKKVAVYTANFGEGEMIPGDIHKLSSKDMPGIADLAWASFPCQDLSLAGNRAGLAGERSGAFWGFWRAVTLLRRENRAPKLLVLENVIGTLSSHEGRDFKELAQAIDGLGYDFGALVIDAVHFVPQSRPRLFIVCVDKSLRVPSNLIANEPIGPWHSQAVCRAASSLPLHLKSAWRWWKLRPPPIRSTELIEILDPDHEVDRWHSPEETSRLLHMMSSTNLQKVKAAQKSGLRTVGTVYKRTRVEGSDNRVQRAEVRFDGIAGCLRTPGGGSSRQIILLVVMNSIRSRLLTVREAAKLMGIPAIQDYFIPDNYNDGYHVFGDGLAVPAVAFLRQNILDLLVRPTARRTSSTSIAAE
jgi:DNA (cytosine-5)-methyltransferase 1